MNYINAKDIATYVRLVPWPLNRSEKVGIVSRIPPMNLPLFIESHEGRMKSLTRKRSGRLGLFVSVRIQPTHAHSMAANSTCAG